MATRNSAPALASLMFPFTTRPLVFAPEPSGIRLRRSAAAAIELSSSCRRPYSVATAADRSSFVCSGRSGVGDTTDRLRTTCGPRKAFCVFDRTLRRGGRHRRRRHRRESAGRVGSGPERAAWLCGRSSRERDRPQPEAALSEVSWEDHAAQIDFYVKSPVLLGRAVLPNMIARNLGRIVQIDSEVVDRIPAGRSAYVTAKSARIGLTRSWARSVSR